MRPHDRTPDRWTASRTLPEPQTQQTHNAELKGTNRQQKSEDDDAATQEPTGTRHGMHMANAPHYRPLGRRTASATLQILHTKQRHTSTAQRYAQNAHRTARLQTYGLSTGTYEYQTRHTHGRCDPPPAPPGRRSASAALQVPQILQTQDAALILANRPLSSRDATVRAQSRRCTRTYPPDPTQATGSTTAPPWRPPPWPRPKRRGTEPCSLPVCLLVMSEPGSVWGGSSTSS